MKRFLLLLTLMALMVGLSACSSHYTPAPIGDEIVWTTHDKGRPDWSVEAPEIEENDDYYIFIGQSRYHSTERGARASAEAHAASLAAQFLARNAKSKYLESASGSDLDSEIQDPNVVLADTTEVTADEQLSRLSVDEWYLENWVRNSKSLWKAFARVKLPKGQTTRMEVEEQKERQLRADKLERERMMREEAQEIREFKQKQAEAKARAAEEARMSEELLQMRQSAVTE